jgi:hypothetical protein
MGATVFLGMRLTWENKMQVSAVVTSKPDPAQAALQRSLEVLAF